MHLFYRKISGIYGYGIPCTHTHWLNLIKRKNYAGDPYY